MRYIPVKGHNGSHIPLGKVVQNLIYAVFRLLVKLVMYELTYLQWCVHRLHYTSVSSAIGGSSTVHYFPILLISTSIVYPCYVNTLYADTLSHVRWNMDTVSFRWVGSCEWGAGAMFLLIHILIGHHWLPSQPLQSERSQAINQCCFLAAGRLLSISQLLFSQCLVLCNVCTAYMCGWRYIKMI